MSYLHAISECTRHGRRGHAAPAGVIGLADAAVCDADAGPIGSAVVVVDARRLIHGVVAEACKFMHSLLTQ